MRELNQFQRYLVHEFVDDYNDGVMGRRDMVARVLKITGSAAAAATMLTTLGVRAADALEPATVLRQATPVATSPLTVPEDDPDILTAYANVPVDNVPFQVYEAYPASVAAREAPAATPVVGGATPVTSASGPFPVIFVCHENRGLTAHIRDVARRFAKQGYIAVAPDLVSPEGGTLNNAASDIPAILSGGDPTRHVGVFQALIAHYGALTDPIDPTRMGMIGFCFGGGVTWQVATQVPEIQAAIPFYGPPPPLEAVPNISAAVLGVYADDPGDFANEGRDELETALGAAGTTFQINVYPGTEHAFHNDTGPRYNEEQALVAWQDSLDWFAQYVV